MPLKKRFKYFVFRRDLIVIIKRTVGKLTKVKSVLRSTRLSSDFAMVQIHVTGGQTVGTMNYAEFVNRTKIPLNNLQCLRIERAIVRGLKPFLLPGDLENE
jgi:hypothetical protein